MLASFGAQIIETWTLPWPEIRVPHYRSGRVGAWELKRQFQPVLRGYFRGLQTAAKNYLLTRDDRVWMSLSPVETDSLAPHVPLMRGHVVIAGLGMGAGALQRATTPGRAAGYSRRARSRRDRAVRGDQGSRLALP